MAVRKIDITIAARSARHLFIITAIASLFLIAGFFTAVLNSFGNPTALLATVCLYFGALLAVRQARRQLNVWAYVTAALCTIALGTIGYFVADSREKDIETKAILSLILLYLIYIVSDFVRLSISRYTALGVTPLILANQVNRALRSTRSSVPWIHKPRHPIRTSIYAALFVVSLPATLLIELFAQPIPIIGYFASIPPIGYSWPIAMAALMRRHYALEANRVLELDGRRPILFLRSFGDDNVRLWGKGFLGKLRRRTIDEAILPLAERVGPFIGIANPSAKLPRIGASQSYYSDDTWQSAIARWASTAHLIVMVAGRTEGIRWELNHIFTNQHHRKLIIFFSPASRKDPTAASQWLRDHFVETRYAVDVGGVDPSKAIALLFEDDDLLIVESKRVSKSEVDYLVAFQAALFAAIETQSTTEIELTGPTALSRA